MNVIAVTQKGLNKTENEDRIIIGKTIVAMERYFPRFLTVF